MILELALPKKSPEKVVYNRPYPIIKQYKRMQYEKDEFNSYQNFLYKRAIFGLSIYTLKEIKKMNYQKKKRIEKISNHTQEVLNLWKQELFILMSNRILGNLFPESSISKVIIDNFSTPDPKFINNWDFKTLKISKKLIVQKLIEEKVLPYNFYEIKEPNKPKSNRPGDSISVL